MWMQTDSLSSTELFHLTEPGEFGRTHSAFSYALASAATCVQEDVLLSALLTISRQRGL